MAGDEIERVPTRWERARQSALARREPVPRLLGAGLGAVVGYFVPGWVHTGSGKPGDFPTIVGLLVGGWVGTKSVEWAARAAAHLRHGRLADREYRQIAERQRDSALAELGARADERMPVEIKRVEPHRYETQSLLRISVVNVGNHRATYYARIVDIRGPSPAQGPEPFDASWRGHNPQLPLGHHSLFSGIPEMINLTYGRHYSYENESVNKTWSVCVPDLDGKGESHHAAPLDGVTTAGDLIDHDLTLEVVVHHVESDQPVARQRVRFFYKRDGVVIVPDLELVE